MGAATHSTSDAHKSFIIAGSGQRCFYGCKDRNLFLDLQIIERYYL